MLWLMTGRSEAREAAGVHIWGKRERVVLYCFMALSYAVLDDKNASFNICFADQDVGSHAGLSHSSAMNVCSDCISKQLCSHIQETEEAYGMRNGRLGFAIICPSV